MFKPTIKHSSKNSKQLITFAILIKEQRYACTNNGNNEGQW